MPHYATGDSGKRALGEALEFLPLATCSLYPHPPCGRPRRRFATSLALHAAPLVSFSLATEHPTRFTFLSTGRARVSPVVINASTCCLLQSQEDFVLAESLAPPPPSASNLSENKALGSHWRLLWMGLRLLSPRFDASSAAEQRLPGEPRTRGLGAASPRACFASQPHHPAFLCRRFLNPAASVHAAPRLNNLLNYVDVENFPLRFCAFTSPHPVPAARCSVLPIPVSVLYSASPKAALSPPNLCNVHIIVRGFRLLRHTNLALCSGGGRGGRCHVRLGPHRPDW